MSTTDTVSQTQEPTTEPKKKGFKVPHTLVLLFGMILLAQVATYILPAGAYESVEVDHKKKVIPGTYALIEAPDPLPVWSAFTAIPVGFEEAQDIIFFIFIIGGAFGVFRASGAADAAIGSLLRGFGAQPFLLLLIGTGTFTAGSWFIGMAEEYIPFIAMLVGLCLALGYDTICGVAIICIGMGVGYGAAGINPFTVAVAQEVAGVEIGSGMGYRIVLCFIFFVVGFHHLWSYACKIKEDPSKSLVADIEVDVSLRPKPSPSLTGSHIAILVLLVVTVAGLVAGIKIKEWYLVEMGAIFLGLAVVIAAVARMGASEGARQFAIGASELTTTALLVGFARSIEVILIKGQVIDTIIHAIAQPLQAMGGTFAAIGMFGVQSIINFFIPSGSGQAYVTMPLMAPLSDLVGVPRQVAVLAYQFGDGFTNIMIPTSAVLIGMLTIAGVPFDRWLRFILPLMVKFFILGSLALAGAVMFGYS